MRALLLIVALAPLAAACAILDEAAVDTERTPLAGVTCEWARVRSVTDGDTIRVDLDDGDENVAVRYIGIDSPEKAGSPAGAEPFGDESTERNRDLVGGEDVCLEKDVSETDRFGRLLRYAWLADGRLVNEVLVAEGLADAVRFPPDVARTAQLEQAEVGARAKLLGIWSD